MKKRGVNLISLAFLFIRLFIDELILFSMALTSYVLIFFVLTETMGCVFEIDEVLTCEMHYRIECSDDFGVEGFIYTENICFD